ncbi:MULTISPECIES: hypothetical protein [unclassified Pseudomonas]|uniref:hypothetical protein n=1 Tax=unclassified Pseudomonas TaxID=196821 RepID=UPI000F73752D|nr:MULTISPECIES: hypothetical protein [unclassified Pseudomonas]
MNISRSGYSIPPGADHIVYGPMNITCLTMVDLKFSDLSGTAGSSNKLRHVIEYSAGGVWSLYSERISTGSTSMDRSFFPDKTGQYRYKIFNTGPTEVSHWRMEGRMPLYSIPGT